MLQKTFSIHDMIRICYSVCNQFCPTVFLIRFDLGFTVFSISFGLQCSQSVLAYSVLNQFWPTVFSISFDLHLMMEIG